MSETRSPSSTPTGRLTSLPEVEHASARSKSSSLNFPNVTPPSMTTTLPPFLDKKVTISAIPEGGLPVHPLTVSGREESSLSLPALSVDEMRSTVRERSRSPGRFQDAIGHGAETNLKSPWWVEKHVSRPWQDRRKLAVPKEQAEALQITRTKVAQAAASALDIGTDILYEALVVGVDLLQLAPVPGLAEAARILLNIWDAVNQIDMYCLACLRLTERCADILLSIRREIQEAGDVVGEELAAPIAKLEESYLSVHRFMLRQIQRPWLKRYLKRSETLSDISACDNLLRDALSLFGVSIQIRILRVVQESERRRLAESQALAASILHNQFPLADLNTELIFDQGTNAITGEPTRVTTFTKSPTETPVGYATSALGLVSDTAATNSTFPMATIESSMVIPAIHSIYEAQNSLDTALDTSDLRQQMHIALQTGADAEILEVLQVKRKETPDAIKTLQRALDRLSDREGGADQLEGKRVVLGKVVRKVSMRDSDGATRPKRSTTIISIESSSSSGDSGASSEIRKRDTLDREFLECGIDALWRMSHGVATTVPNWTITKYEVDRDEKIGVGFFSDVYKGTWRGRTVAIKVLAESTPRTLFVREIGIWQTLRHPNVLRLYGASSATGDPPWFFVSPYMKNGSLVEYLKRVELEMSPPGLGVGSNQSLPTTPFRSPATLPATPNSTPVGAGNDEISSAAAVLTVPSRSPFHGNNHVQREWDLFRLMHEVAKGMSYLHSNSILHGDLKAANVLVDDQFRCVISDFGQSEMKSEAYRISGTSPRGTLRWQSPERMLGQSQLTTADDVWAFSICCVEILNMGRMPWSLMDDNTVRHFVLKDLDNSRPSIPKNSRFNTPGLQDILSSCWNTNSEQRPSFSQISRRLKSLRRGLGQDVSDSPGLPPIEDVPEVIHSTSPDLRPNLPTYVQNTPDSIPNDVLDTTRLTSSEKSHRESTVITGQNDVSQPVIYTPAESQISSRTSSVLLQHVEDEPIRVIHLDGYESPPPIDERIAQTKNERRYRLLLTHDYHPSLSLPLWSPTPVPLGAVGYLSKPSGEFITLFSAFNPDKASHPLIGRLPSIDGYGHAGRSEFRQDRRTVAQKALDLIGGNLTFGSSSKQVSRRYSFPLKSGHKIAYLCAEITQYEYMASLEAPRKWFQLHVDTVMQAYGQEHQIQREDLVLVIGALRVPNYGLFVSHSHPEGHVHFSVYTSQKVGQPWGTFTTDADVAPGTGPSYYGDEFDIPSISSSKVSRHGDPWCAILLARLRFKPDAIDPTSK